VKADQFQVGQEVFGTKDPAVQGTFAEYIVCCPNDLAPKPQNLSHVEAASLPYAALTAAACIMDAGKMRNAPQVNEKKSALILGASGGVGLAAIQYLKAWGFGTVVGTCRDHAMDTLKSIGCDEATSNEEILASGRQFDLIIDSLPGDNWATYRPLLARHSSAHYVVLNPSLLPNMDRHSLMGGAMRSMGGLMAKARIFPPCMPYKWGIFAPSAERLRTLSEMVAQQTGGMRPVVQAQFPLSALPDAMRRYKQGGVCGKIVVEVVPRATEGEQPHHAVGATREQAQPEEKSEEAKAEEETEE